MKPIELQRTRNDLLARIANFLAETGMTARAFGIRATGNHRFVPRLRLGLGTVGSIEKAEAFMDRYRQACEAGAENDRETQEAA